MLPVYFGRIYRNGSMRLQFQYSKREFSNVITSVPPKLPDPCNLLAIETSCDDTCVCIVSFSPTERLKPYNVLFEKNIHQGDLLQKFGGVFPFKAAERHRSMLPELLYTCNSIPIHAIAATRGPGLSPCLSVGWNAGKMLSARLNIPLFDVHHMEGHSLVARASNPNLELPYFALLVSGGHTMLVYVENRDSSMATSVYSGASSSSLAFNYTLLGETLDNSIGEAFDKGARLLNIDEPTGAALSKVAINGDPFAFPFSLPLKGRPTTRADFSFSGLRTELAKHWDGLSISNQAESKRADLAASYQRALVDHIIDRIQIHFKNNPKGKCPLVLSGGVACNDFLRSRLSEWQHQNRDIIDSLIVPNRKYCTDNAFMIAWVAMERVWKNLAIDHMDPKSIKQSISLDIAPEWPLFERS